jgi:hypothetical protein
MDFKDLKFTTIAKAKKETGLSYLGKINSSAKIMKGHKKLRIDTYIIYLAPANTSGYNVCNYSTPECRLGCLATSGRAKLEAWTVNSDNRIKNSRIKKTKLFHENNKYFMEWLVAELAEGQRKAIKNDYEFAVRLNGTSDIDWVNYRVNGSTVFGLFPTIQFYDYTKHFLKMVDNLPNYHLTFSYSGRNTDSCKHILEQGMNIAVVFDTKKGETLPLEFMGYPVIDGDLTDVRYLDAKRCVVGLRWKRIANRDAETRILNSSFVVKANELVLEDCNV